jgi:hypothetical protein
MGILRTNEISGLETPTAVTGSVVFDGTGDYLIVNAQTINSNQWTLECWIYPTNLTGNKWLFSQYAAGDANRTSLYIDDGILLVFNGNQGSTSGNSTLSTNQWYHLAFVRNGSTLTAYLNGVQEFQKTNFAGPYQSNTYIGSYDGSSGTDNFQGYISNVRVVNSILYSSNFTPPVHELQPIGDTVLLCCNSSTSATAEATGKTITVNGNAAASTFSPGLTRDFTYGTQFEGVAKFDTQGYFVPPSGNTQNRYTLGLDEIVTDGLVLHLDAGNPFSYPVTGVGTKWTDLSGNNNHGTLNGGVSYTENNRGALVFDGVNDYVVTAYTPPNTNWSISMFFNATEYPSYNRGLFSTYSTTNFNGIYCGTSFSNQLWVFTDSNQRLDLTYTFIPNIWYQITFTITTNQVFCYVNGTLINQINATTTHKDVLNIGRTRFSLDYWKGRISQTQIYNKALTASEVLQNYNALRGRFGI